LCRQSSANGGFSGNLSDGANHAWLTSTFASTGVEVQEIVMVPDKATGLAKGSAFVFVAGKKVSRCRPNAKLKTSIFDFFLTDLQNAERLILLLHECVACPDAPQVKRLCRGMRMHALQFSLFCNLQLHSPPNNIRSSPPPTPPPLRSAWCGSTTPQGKKRGSRPTVFPTPIISITWHFVTITRLANLEATFKLFIGNLPPDPSVELLQQMFAGRDAQEFIPIKNKPGMPNLKGSAFVKMGR
jgi:hypothetical protein